MSNWTFKGKEILSEDDIPIDNAIGFVYIITQKSTGKRYIGRKLLTKASSKVVKGKKKKIRTASDWLTYWSSSPQIKEWIRAAGGPSDFTKEILGFVSSKGMLAYAEEFFLYSLGVLESDDWLNQNIRSKIYRNWVKPEETKILREVLNNLKGINNED
jgi:hypothetical protein